MKIALAQFRPEKGDLIKNVRRHLDASEAALQYGADAVFFPELSLTSYEPTLAGEWATTSADERLMPLKEISTRAGITIGAGLPAIDKGGTCITMVIFRPDGNTLCYSKQMLHADELPFFIPGNRQVLVPMGNDTIAPAICYESLQPAHYHSAAKLGASVYLASVAKSKSGILKGYSHYPAMAKACSLPVLMVNAVGFCDNFLSAGQSAVWNKEGVLLGSLHEQREGLLIFDTETEEVQLDNF